MQRAIIHKKENGNMKEEQCEAKNEFVPVTQMNTIQMRKRQDRARNMKAKTGNETSSICEAKESGRSITLTSYKYLLTKYLMYMENKKKQTTY